MEKSMCVNKRNTSFHIYYIDELGHCTETSARPISNSFFNQQYVSMIETVTAVLQAFISQLINNSCSIERNMLEYVSFIDEKESLASPLTITGIRNTAPVQLGTPLLFSLHIGVYGRGKATEVFASSVCMVWKLCSHLVFNVIIALSNSFLLYIKLCLFSFKVSENMYFKYQT